MKIMVFLFVLLLFVSTTQAQSAILESDRITHNAATYPMMLVFGEGVKANPQKGVAILKELRDIESAKIPLAYCLYYGIGTEKDVSTAKSLIGEVKSFTAYHNAIKYFGKNIDFLFVIFENLKEIALEKEMASYLLWNTQATRTRKDITEKIISKFETNIPVYANELYIKYYNDEDIENFVKCLPYLKGDKLENALNFAFDFAITKNDAKLAKIAIEIANKPENKIEKNFSAINIAYCLEVGLGVEKNPKEAEHLIEETLKDKELSGRLDQTFPTLAFQNNDASKAKFAFDISKKFAKIGYTNSIANCYNNGIGVKRDIVKALEFLQKSTEREKAFKIYVICANTPIEDAPKEVLSAYFHAAKTISEKYKNSDLSINLACCYLNGIGTEKNYEEALKILNTLVNLNPDYYATILALEIIAYCQENGLGTEKDLNAAKLTRKKVEEQSEYRVKKYKENIYNQIKNLYSDKKGYQWIAADESMFAYYQGKDDRANKLIAELSRSKDEIKAFDKFEKITKELKDAKNDKAKKDEAIKKLEELFEDLAKAKKYYIEDIAHKAMYSKKSFFALRMATLPSLIKVAKNCNNAQLYKFIAKCYQDGKGTSRNKEKYADACFEVAKLESPNRNGESKTYFRNAVIDYGICGNFDKMKVAIDEWKKVFPNSNTAKWFEIKLLSLPTSPYFDTKLANKKFKELADEIKDTREYNILGNETYGAGNIAITNFSRQLILEGYRKENKASSGYLIPTYIDGISAPKDLNKAADLLKKYVEEIYNYSSNYHDYSLLKYIISIKNTRGEKYIYDIGDSLTQKNKEPLGSVVKAFALLNGWGVEKDKAQARKIFLNATKYIRDNSKNSLLRSITSTCDSPYTLSIPNDITRDLLKKLSDENFKDDFVFAMGYNKIGEFEKSLEYARKYDANKKRFKTLELGLLASKRDDPISQKQAFEIAKKMSEKKDNSAQIIYANYLYEGKHCPKDVDKAISILKSVEKRYSNDRIWGMNPTNACLSLWRIYTEIGDTKNAEKMKEKIKNFGNVSSTTAPLVCAMQFKGQIPYYTHYLGIDKNDEYAKQWLKYAEEEMLTSRFADEIPFKVAELYMANTEFKNPQKAEEILQKCRDWLEKFKNNELEKIEKNK